MTAVFSRCVAMGAVVIAGMVPTSCIDNTKNRFPAGDPNVLPSTGDGPSPTNVLPARGDDGPWAIAVVGSDYLSSSVSIVDRETRGLFREGIIDSGSMAPGLSTALSGDVVLPRANNQNHWLVLLDRYPNSVVTFIDPNDFSVIGQLSVATGFAANPHDFLWLTSHKAYVTRYEANPRPGREPHDGGDDLLIIDPTDRLITGRIPLKSYADVDTDAELQARPDQMVLAQGLVWVSLNHLTGNFRGAGEGRIVAIDPVTDRVLQTVVLPEVTNCSAVVHVANLDALFVSCSGLFASDTAAQLRHSGIVKIDLTQDPPQASLLRRGTGGSARPYGFDLEHGAGAWLLAVRFGDLIADIPDRLVMIDIAGGEESTLYEAHSAYGLGGMLVDEVTATVYVGDADSVSPGIRVFELTGGGFVHLSTIDAHPQVGLPPRHIRFY